jgi:DNA polymerase
LCKGNGAHLKFSLQCAKVTNRKKAAHPCYQGKDSPTPFTPDLPESIPRTRSLPPLSKAMKCCTRCELALNRTQVVVGVGDPKARVLLIGEAPGEKEDLAGRPFVGSAGKLLERMLEKADLNRDDVFITNIVACRPPANRTPRAREVKAHAPWIEEQLRHISPEVVVTLGRVALTYFIPKAKVTQLRGKPQDVQHGELSVVLLPTLHPAAALRDPELRPSLEADFRKLGALLKRRRRSA